MEDAVIAHLALPKMGLLSLPNTEVEAEAQLPTYAQIATRRERDVRHERYHHPDDDLEVIAGQVSCLDHKIACEAVSKLWELTVLTRRNHVANQLALAGLGGVSLLLEYVMTITDQSSTIYEHGANMALLVFENLSANVQLHHEMASNAALLRFLLATINHQSQPAMRANAAKVLVNLTFSNPQLQNKVARAGAVSAALVLLRGPELGLVRQGVWLLSHISSGQGCAAREELGTQIHLLQRLLDILTDNEDRITKARVCEVLCNLARGDMKPHHNFIRASLVPALMALLDPSSDHRQEPAVVAPALLALAALAAAGNGTILRSMALERQLAFHIAGILGYSNTVTRDYDMSRVMMAAHALIFSLGRFVVKDKVTASIINCPDYVKELLQKSGYVSFQHSLLALGLELPQYVAASVGKDLGGPNCFVANTLYQVNVELLPLLKNDNARMVTNACARLYQIATCLRNYPEGRLVLANASLLVALGDLLTSEHSSVLQAALSLVDALAAVPELVPLLVEKGVLDTVNNIADQQAVIAMVDSKGEVEALEAETATAAAWERTSILHGGSNEASTASRSDPLVKMLAERALVTMFLAQSG